MADAGRLFEDVRVLDFTHFLAGPFCTVQLALQGADVVKVEPIGGDPSRGGSVAPEWAARGLGASWMAANVNKRSIVLDLARPEAVEIVERLVRDVDVVCENFRPGVMERLGIGWPQLRRINPRLIYCAISGFGSTGPERRTASFDGKIQAMSGLMSITGDPEGGPMRAGYAVADVTAGLTAAFAVAGALHQRDRSGEGQFVDVAMLDSMLACLSYQVAEYTVGGHRHVQAGNLSVTRKPTAARFRCREGWLVLAVLTGPQFERLMRAIGCDDALADPRFADWPSRIAHGDALHALVEAALRADDADAWERRLVAADVPCARVRTIAEIVEHPQVAHRGLLQTAPTPFGPVTLAGAGFRLEHGTGGIDRPIARAGEHTADVLRSIGYDDARIDALRDAGVVGCAA